MKILVISFCILFSWRIEQSFAGIPTVDAPNTVGEVVQNVTNFVKKTNEKLKDAQNKIMGKFIGKIEEAKKYAETQKARLDAEVSSVKSTVDDAKSSVNEVKNTAEGYKAEAENAINEKKKYAEYAAAKTQKVSVESSYKEAVQAQNENYNAQVAAIDQNIATIRSEMSAEGITEDRKKALEENIVQLELSKQNLADENQTFLVSLAEERDATLVPLEETISSLESELKASGLNKLEGEFNKIVDTKDPTAPLKEVSEKAFTDAESTENITKVKTWRRNSFADDKISAMSDALRSLNEISTQSKKVSDPDVGVSSGVHLTEGFSSAVTISNDVKIEQAKAMLSYNKQLISMLKLKTSEQLANSTINKINEKQDLNNFSLDSYNYEVVCGGSK